MVESMANSVEDYLIDGLSFKLKPGASYINERKSVTFHPQGGNHYTPSGVRLIKFSITGDQWLDPSTFRIVFNLANAESDALKELRPLSGPHSFFKRMRVLCNGQVVEDIDDYNRVHEMFSMLQPSETRFNDAVEGFGSEWDTTDYQNSAVTKADLPAIEVGSYITVLFKPMSGLLMQPKYLPLRYCPLQIELELVNDAKEPIMHSLVDNTDDPYPGSPFTKANTSLLWRIESVMAKCDVCTLDNGLDNSYAEHLLSGKSLPINYNTFISQIQSLLTAPGTGQQKIRLNITRAITRLKSVFVTLFQEYSEEYKTEKSVARNRFNTFYSPMWFYFDYNKDGEYQFQLQLGSKLYPEYPITSHAEGFYQLRKAIGAHQNKNHHIDITAKEYQDSKFVLAIDMERVLEAGFTGMNTRAGDILNVRFDHNNTNPKTYAHEMQVILHSDNILEIRDSGVTVFD